MNSRHRLELFKSIIADATQNSKDRQELEQSRLGRKVQNGDQQFAQDILDTANRLDSVEDMVAFEQTLQTLDLLKAKSVADRNSIIAARRHYEKFALTIKQLRSNTDSYFLMNKANIKSKGDPGKVLKSNSIDFLTSNITRMQNRKQFVSESESKVWEARIAMAKKTGEMFKALHRGLAEDSARK